MQQETQGTRQGTSDAQQGTRQGVQGNPLVIARGLGLKTYAGYAYRGVDLDVRKGEVVAVRGRHGSGKTALLLALAGRMRQTEGTLRVGEYELPRQRAKAANLVGMSLFEGLNDLQDSLTVAYAMAAEFELYGRKPRREAVLESLHRWGLHGVADVRVKDLTSEELTVLGIALAFVRHPDVIVVDDIERELTMGQSERIMQLLISRARERNVGIVVGLVERKLAAMADACVYLSKGGE